MSDATADRPPQSGASSDAPSPSAPTEARTPPDGTVESQSPSGAPDPVESLPPPETPPDPLLDALCPKCSYPLRGLDRPRCPECGTAWTIAELTESHIPWVHRRRIGFWRAYWATVWMTTARTDRFCNELSRPVSYLHACRFWRVTVCLATLGAALLFAAPMLPWLVRRILLPFHPNFLLEDPGPFVIVFCVLTVPLGVALLLGACMFFFRPRSAPVAQQNRGVALSLYACGPLAVMPLPAFLLALIGLVDGFHAPHGYDWPAAVRAAQLLAALIVTALLLALWGNCWWLALRQTGSAGRALWVAIALPVVWGVLAVLVWIVLPVTFLHLDLIVGWH